MSTCDNTKDIDGYKRTPGIWSGQTRRLFPTLEIAQTIYYVVGLSIEEDQPAFYQPTFILLFSNKPMLPVDDRKSGNKSSATIVPGKNTRCSKLAIYCRYVLLSIYYFCDFLPNHVEKF
jgi:hypothetical protein